MAWDALKRVSLLALAIVVACALPASAQLINLRVDNLFASASVTIGAQGFSLRDTNGTGDKCLSVLYGSAAAQWDFCYGSGTSTFPVAFIPHAGTVSDLGSKDRSGGYWSRGFISTLYAAAAALSGGTPSDKGLVIASGVPASTTTNLYNSGGALYWAGSALLAGSGGTAITSLGGNVSMDGGATNQGRIRWATGNVFEIRNYADNAYMGARLLSGWFDGGGLAVCASSGCGGPSDAGIVFGNAVPSSTAYNLYRSGADLYFNGNKLSTTTGVTGSGTAGKIAKWSGTSGITDSIFSESGSDGTVTGTLTISAQPAARVYKSADSAAFADASDTVITFDSETTDVGACHSTSSNTSRLTAPVAGVYLVTGTVEYFEPTNWGTFRQSAWIRLNGTSANAIAKTVIQTGNFTTITLNMSGLIYLAANDYVELLVRADGGPGDAYVKGGTTYRTHFEFTKVN
jgi:hypothetical protein